MQKLQTLSGRTSNFELNNELLKTDINSAKLKEFNKNFSRSF